VRVSLAGAAVIVFALWQLSWTSPAEHLPPPPPSTTPRTSSVARLLWQPPVEKLDVIDQQRDAVFTVLEQLDKE